VFIGGFAMGIWQLVDPYSTFLVLCGLFLVGFCGYWLSRISYGYFRQWSRGEPKPVIAPLQPPPSNEPRGVRRYRRTVVIVWTVLFWTLLLTGHPWWSTFVVVLGIAAYHAPRAWSLSQPGRDRAR
jgi:hypothetical protein